MNNFFKKTLVASAVLAFASTTQAATIVGTEHSLTNEYLASTGANHAVAQFTLTLQSDYVLNDTVTLTFSQPLAVTAATALTAPAIAGVADDPATAGVDETVAATKGITLTAISGGQAGDTQVTYRVTSVIDAGGVGAPGSVAGAELLLPAYQFAKANLSGGVSIQFSAQTNAGQPLDTAGTAAQRNPSLAKVINQFTTTAPSLNKVIDVNSDRKSFVGVNAAARQVTATFNIASQTTAGAVFARPIAAVNGVKHTITGDFSWVVDDSTAAGLQPKNNVFTQTGICTNAEFTFSTTAVSLECDEIATNTAIVIDAEANKTGVAAASIPVLNPQSFTATSVVQLTGPVGTVNVFDNAAAGAWTLNGSQVRVPYMVVGGNRFGIIANVANHGSKDGAVSLDVFAEDGTALASNYPAGTSVAGSVTSVAGPLNAALSAAGVSTSSPVKFSFQVTTNVPEDDITVYAAYTDNTTSERAVVNTDMKVQTK